MNTNESQSIMKTKLLQNMLNHSAHGLSRRSFAKAEVTRPSSALLLCLLWLATTFMAQAAPVVTNVTVILYPASVNISY